MKWWQIVFAALAISGGALVASCNGCGGGVVVPDGRQPDEGPDQQPGTVGDRDGRQDETAPINNRITRPAQARSCLSELFLVDVPLGESMPSADGVPYATLSENARRAIEQRLTEQAGGSSVAQQWLAKSCAGPVRVALDDVLAEAPGVTDERRHQLLFFFCEGDPARTPIAVRPDAQCTLLSEVDGFFRAQIGANARIQLARDCDARGQQEPAIPWHHTSVGTFPPIVNASPVSVVIADDAGQHGANVRALVDSMLTASPSSSPAPAPASVSVATWPVLKSGKGTPTSHIARELGKRIAALPDGGAPVVLNMSFGWPPEMGRFVTLANPNGCQFTEGPAGLAVASVLGALKAKNPHSLAFAAIGNRNVSLNYRRAVGNPQGACLPNHDFRGAPPFFPAAWAWPAADGCGVLESALTIAVGSHGVEEAEGNIGAAEAELYAPGRQVSIPIAPPVNGTGTSYATAIASGTAARLLAGTDPQVVNHAWFIETHTCGEAGSTKRLRVHGGAAPNGGNPVEPCRVAGMTAGDPPADPCPGSTCETGAMGATSTGGVSVAAGLNIDAFALGLATPQPDVPICIGTSCFTMVDGALKKCDLFLRLADPTVLKVAPDVAMLRVYHSGSMVHDTEITTPLMPGKSYAFSGVSLPAELHGDASRIKTATFWLRYKMSDGKTSAWFEDPLDLYFK